MPNLDDFHAFKSTTGESDNGGTKGRSSNKIYFIAVVAFAALYVIGKIIGW